MTRFCLDSASAEYRHKREALRRAEIALKDQRETVAVLRRNLPADTPVAEDYAFTEAAGGGERPVRLSMLFAPGQESLIVYHYMWAPEDADPCPMCTMWLDGLDAVQPHVARTAPFVAIVKQAAGTVRAFADRRGWTRLRLLSSGGTNFNRDFGMETPEGGQLPGLSVFLKRGDGAIRHFCTTSALLGDDHYRGMDLFSPVWHLFDMLPEGRGDFMPRMS